MLTNLQYQELIRSVQDLVRQAESYQLEYNKLNWSIQGILDGAFLGKTISARMLRKGKSELWTIKVHGVSWKLKQIQFFGEHRENDKTITEPFLLELTDSVRIRVHEGA